MASSITIPNALEMPRTGSLARSKYTSNIGLGKPNVVAILPRGEAIRNFVYTGALEEVTHHAKLTVLSVAPTEELGEQLRQRYGNVIRLNDIRDKWLVGIQRDLLDSAHGRWLWSEAARERWRLRDREAVTPGQKVKRAAKKAISYPFASRAGLAMLTGAMNLSSRLLPSTDEYVKLFREIKPSLVFNGSHVHSRIAVPVIEAARWLGIPTATFIFSWDNLTSQGRIMPLYDYYFVWNQQIRKQLLSIYRSISPDHVFVTGTPQFDLHFRPAIHWTREEFCHRVGADPARPLILYSTGMPNHMPGEPKIIEGIADHLRDMKEHGAPQLLVRIYPKDQTGRFDDLKQRRPDILFPEIPWEPAWQTPKEEDGPLLVNMLRHAAVGINVASTVSLELCMFDKPVINVAYNPAGVAVDEVNYARYYDFDHYRPVVESGAVVLARSEAEMGVLLREALVNSAGSSAKRGRLVKSMFGKLLDGQAGLRVARQLVSIAYKHSHPLGARSMVKE